MKRREANVKCVLGREDIGEGGRMRDRERERGEVEEEQRKRKRKEHQRTEDDVTQ